MKLIAILLLFGPALAAADNDCPTLSVGKGVCARLYDESNCEGWDFEAGEGYSELGILQSDDAEVVAVAPGCILTVFDEDDSDVSKITILFRLVNDVIDFSRAKGAIRRRSTTARATQFSSSSSADP